MDGAPKGNYDVELVMSQYKSCSVFKRYYVPLMTKLPAELKVQCCSFFVWGVFLGESPCEKVGMLENLSIPSRLSPSL